MIVLAKLQSDAIIRAGGDGWVPAKSFLRACDDQGVEVADELEAADLLNDLIELKLIDEWSSPHMGGATRAFLQRRFRPTKRGYALVTHDLEPIPSIADERLGD